MKVLHLAFVLALSGSVALSTTNPPTIARPSSPPALPPGGDPILEVFNDSLTTYLASGATSVQDVRPLALQRGVNLDGSLRAASTLSIDRTL